MIHVFFLILLSGVELAGASKRMWTGMVIHVFFALGLVVLVGIGYLLRHARYILVASAGLNGLLLIYWWYVICAVGPPRWRRGSGLDFGSDDSGSIPRLPSPRVGPLMARR